MLCRHVHKPQASLFVLTCLGTTFLVFDVQITIFKQSLHSGPKKGLGFKQDWQPQPSIVSSPLVSIDVRVRIDVDGVGYIASVVGP